MNSEDRKIKKSEDRQIKNIMKELEGFSLFLGSG